MLRKRFAGAIRETYIMRRISQGEATLEPIVARVARLPIALRVAPPELRRVPDHHALHTSHLQRLLQRPAVTLALVLPLVRLFPELAVPDDAVRAPSGDLQDFLWRLNEDG